eukprot:3751092-Rhodomonas_salina.1
MSYLKPRATAITVCGDMNAAWGRDRVGYVDNPARDAVDDAFTRWVTAEGFQIPERSYEHTWRATDGPQRAHLDYMLVWSAEAVQYDTA